MTLTIRTMTFALACVVATALAAPGQEDPFAPGGAPQSGGAKPAPAAQDTPDESSQHDHPVVAAIREANPQTPMEWMLAARAVAQVEAYSAAKGYLQRVLSANLDADARYAIAQKFGTAYVLQLRLMEELQPEGSKLADSIMAAVRERWGDADFVAQRLHDAAQARGRSRLARVAELRGGGDLPVVLLMQWLADDRLRPEAEQIIRSWNPTYDEALGQALMAFWSLRLDSVHLLPETRIGQVTPLLLSTAVAQSDDSGNRAAAQEALQKMLGRLPSQAEVRDHLWALVRQHLDEARAIRRDDPMARAIVWAWKTDLSAIEPRDVWKDEYETLWAGRAAVALAHVDPQDRLARQLLHLMEFQLHYGGEDPDHGIAISSIEIEEDDAVLKEAEDLDTLLRLAIEGQLAGAAAHVCEKMALVGHRESLVGSGGQPSILVATLQHPDRNVRHAATMSVAQLAQGAPAFPGAGLLTDSLRFFMTSHGEARILIAATRVDRATEFAAAASVLGFRADFAGTGRDLVKKLHQDADFGAVFVDSAIADPPLRETVQQIRKSPRGREMVILVMARGDNVDELEEAFRDDSRIVVRVSIPNADALAEDIRRLLAQAGRWRTMPTERLAQAKQAMELATALLEDDSAKEYVDGSRWVAAASEALFSDELSVAAARLLSRIGTDGAQRSLVEFALRRGETERSRKAAAVAAAEHIGHFRLLLRRAEVELLLDATRSHQDDPISTVVRSLLRASLGAAEAATDRSPQATESGPEEG